MTSIALIVMDTLRKDTFDEYFDWLPGYRFENAFSTSHYTVPAHASIFSGRYPSEVGVHAWNEVFNCPGKPLAEELSTAGFSTYGFSENLLLSEINNFNRGFDSFDHIGRAVQVDSDVFNWTSAVNGNGGSSLLRDMRLIKKCFLSGKNMLKSMKVGIKMKRRSFHGAKELKESLCKISFTGEDFLFANLMEMHGPYRPPEQYRPKMPSHYGRKETETLLGGNADFDPERQAYRGCAEYLSSIYKDIFEKLKKDFDYIITTADHGELFGEHGACQHWYGLYPELVRVPLVISGGDLENRSREEMVSLLDIHKTILSLGGVDGDSRGRNLTGEFQPNGSLTEFHGLRDSRIQTLKNEGFSPDDIQKYNQELHGIVLPGGYYGYEDATGFKQTQESPIKSPKNRLRELKQDLDVREISEQREEYNSEIEDQLKYLGYA